MPSSQTTKPAELIIKPAPMPVFPTMDSLQSVVELAYSQLPDVPTNVVLTLFMTYHNTLLKILEEETNYVPRK